MSYAIRKDGTGWRAVDSASSIDQENEVFSTSIPKEDTSIDLAKAELLVQQRLDDFAKIKGYNTIDTAVSYVNSIVVEYSEEGLKAKNFRDETWAALYRAFSGKKKSYKTFKEVEKLLPEISWE